MSVIKDNARYDRLHNRLLRDLLLAIKDELDAADLDHDLVHELTANIALAVSDILDGASPIEAGGELMVPFLAFSSESQRDQLVVNEHGSYLHELVDTLFDEVVDEEEEYDDDEEEDEDDDEEEFDEEDDDVDPQRRH